MKGVQAHIEYGTRKIKSTVKKGIIGTAEFGILEGETEIPESKISILAGDTVSGLAAWVHVAEKSENGNFEVLHEGWISNETSQLESFTDSPVSVSLVEVELDEHTFEGHSDVTFGSRKCCTSRGNGCYVRCCNSCCSDPTRCPGASCCAR